MYESFFGLRERPFDLVPNPRFLFLTARQREAFSNLRYGLSVPRGLTLLLGEPGTGKTTLLQAMLSEVDQERVECVLLSNPTLTRAEFYEFLATGFGLGAEAIVSKTQFLFALHRHLQARHEAGQLSALVLDEAQSLPYELLEEVRLLSNIETAAVKLLNVVLAGQPELAARLNEPGLRALKQRIALRCELGVFDFPETGAYVAGRLRIAGGEPASIFTREVLNGLLRIGFLYPQQIIWNKGRTVLTRTHYWYQHEPCWYLRKKNAPWFGKAGENSTIWDSPSPKFIMGGSDEEKFDHPTQKPVELMRRPILNHTKRGEGVYDPFLGSGTTLAAAELAERVCYGIELDPKYIDVIVMRWQSLANKKATLDGDGRSFDEIAQERLKGAA